MIQKIKTFVLSHIFTSIGIVLVLLVGGNWVYGKVTATGGVTKYIVGRVERGTISSSIAGSGQVSVSQNLGIKPKSSGDVTAVLVKKGQKVTAGTPLIQIDSRDAAKAVRDAQLNVQSATLSLEKLTAAPDALSLLQAQNAYAQAQREYTTLKNPPEVLDLLQAENALTQATQSKALADSELTKAYDDVYTEVSTDLADAPDLLSNLDTMFFDKTIDSFIDNYNWYSSQLVNDNDGVKAIQTRFRSSYDLAVKDLETVQNLFKTVERTSDKAAIENLVQKTKVLMAEVSDAVNGAKNYVSHVETNMKDNDKVIPAIIGTHKTSLTGYVATADSDLATISSQQSSLETKKNAVENAQRSLLEKQQSLTNLKNGADEDDLKKSKEVVAERKAALDKLTQGPDALDLKSAQLTLQERRNALSDAQEKLADCLVKAQFDGVVADIVVKKGDAVTSATAIATLITDQMVAEIPLNEVDVAQIVVGQKATLSFDAVQDLFLTGEVAELDSIGTVSQGVVSYKVKITFDTQDARIKSGMSTVATIITDVKTDVLLVANSAVKSQNGSAAVDIPASRYAEISKSSAGTTPVVLSSLPVRTVVETGLQNDTQTEVVSGLIEGDFVIISTIAPQAAAQASGTSAVRLPGLGGSGSGATRAMGR